MKRTYKFATLIIVCAASCPLFFSSCSGDKIYYRSKPNPVQAIKDTYGEPVQVERLANGSEKLIYYVHDPLGTGYVKRYFVIKEGKVVDGGSGQ